MCRSINESDKSHKNMSISYFSYILCKWITSEVRITLLSELCTTDVSKSRDRRWACGSRDTRHPIGLYECGTISSAGKSSETLHYFTLFLYFDSFIKSRFAVFRVRWVHKRLQVREFVRARSHVVLELKLAVHNTHTVHTQMSVCVCIRDWYTSYFNSNVFRFMISLNWRDRLLWLTLLVSWL